MDIVWRIPISFYCFQYAPERGAAKVYLLKYWSKLKVSGNKVVGYCLENPNQFLLLPVCSRKGGAKIYFLKYWSRLKLSGNKVEGYCLENPNQFPLFPFLFQKGAGLKFIP